jgi:membrane-associated phospholipid phosphatase
MALSPVVRPVDRLLQGYNVLLAGLWIAMLGLAPYAPAILAAHLAAVALPWLLRRAALGGAMRVLWEIYPLLWLCAFWSELDFIRHMLHPVSNDALVRALDLRLFGVHLDQLWMAAMPHVWFSEVMHLAYFAYYPLIFLPPVIAALAGRTEASRDMTYRLLLTYVGCYLVYMAFPVDGPGATLPRFDGELTGGVIYQLVHGAVRWGDSLGCAFPSSHVAGAVTIAMLGWRWFRPGVAALLTIEAAGVFVSTVYTQQHYAIDAVAGLVLAVALQSAVAPWLALALAPAAVAPAERPRALTPVSIPARASSGGQ